MRGIKYTQCFLPISLLITMTCCQSDQVIEDVHDSVTLQIHPSLVSDVTVSRALPVVVDGDNFGISNNINKYPFGLWLCKAGSLELYSSGMDNVEAIFDAQKSTSDAWDYYYGGTYHKQLSAKPESEIEIYAYYPYKESEIQTTEIPFSIPGDDLLWARPVKIHTGKANSIEKVNLIFEHKLTCLEFNIRVLYPSTENYLQELKIIDIQNDKTFLFDNGVLNIVTGEIQVDHSKGVNQISFDKINVEIPRDNTTIMKIDIPIIPFDEYRNESLMLILGFSAGKGKMASEIRSVKLPTIGNSSSMDFKQGYKYTYELIIDNAMKIRALEECSEWSDGSKIDFTI